MLRGKRKGLVRGICDSFSYFIVHIQNIYLIVVRITSQTNQNQSQKMVFEKTPIVLSSDIHCGSKGNNGVAKTDDDQSMTPSSSSSTSSNHMSSNHDETSKFESSHISGSNDKEERNVLAKSETKNVNRLRAIVGIVLILSTLILALTIYFYVRNKEQTDFQQAYESDTDRLFDGIGMNLQTNLGAMQSFAALMIAIAKQTNQTFPFFTMPEFALKAARLLTLTSGIQISIQTIISSEKRLEWEAYSMANEWWVNETKAVQELDPFYYGEVPYGVPNPGQIWDYAGVVPYNDTK
jgi:hypothetical protein